MAQCRHCSRNYSEGGDGYDGMCPRCADRSECKTCEGTGSVKTTGAETVLKGVRCSVSTDLQCLVCNGDGHFDNPAEARAAHKEFAAAAKPTKVRTRAVRGYKTKEKDFRIVAAFIETELENRQQSLLPARHPYMKDVRQARAALERLRTRAI